MAVSSKKTWQSSCQHNRGRDCGAERYCLLPTAYCLLPTAYCLLPAFLNRPVLLLVIVAVGAAARALDPVRVLPVPADGFSQPRLPRLPRPPAEFGFGLRRVDGVAAVVAGAVFDELEERARLAQGFED